MNTKNNNEQNHTTEAKNEIKKMADLAHTILDKNTTNKKNKEAIKSILKSQKSKCYKTKISIRLILIDNYYSTNMSMNLYSIEDLSKKIAKISNNDEQLKKMFENFLKNPSNNNVIYELFEPKDKYGVSEKRAHSLISKYAYFLLDYQFPIYDGLAKKSYDILKNYYKDKDLKLQSRGNTINEYFTAIKELNKFIHNYEKYEKYEKLDNLLWLLGKINKSVYSYILTREQYENLNEIIKEYKGNKFASFYDKFTTIYNLKKFFDNDLIKMIHYLAKIKELI